MTPADTIYQAAREAGVPDTVARLMIAQSEQETAQWTSPVFLDDHNGFGMKVPSIRKDPYIAGPSVHVRTSEGTVPYAHYNNLSDSTKSLVNWIQYNKINYADIDTPDKYATVFKQKGYYGDLLSTYLYNMTQFYNKIKDTAFKYKKQIGVAVAALALIGVGIFIFTKRKTLF